MHLFHLNSDSESWLNLLFNIHIHSSNNLSSVVACGFQPVFLMSFHRSICLRIWFYYYLWIILQIRVLTLDPEGPVLCSFSDSYYLFRMFVPSVWMLCFSSYLLKLPSWKAQPATIGQLSHAWAGTTHCVSQSALLLLWWGRGCIVTLQKSLQVI